MRHLVIGTAGHIDHGKSALVEALTGVHPDRLKEEKARGITIDLGFAHVERDGVRYAFVDVPGHERFVKNMLAGVWGIDAVMLVVAADESVMPQTREHFDISRLLQVRSGLVVITKADLVDPDTLELVRLEVAELVSGSFLDDAPVVAVSARTGAGLAELARQLAGLAVVVPERSSDGPVRLPIDRVFSVRGFGTVVTGTLVSGAVRPDAELLVLPQALTVKVRGIQVHGQPAEAAFAGERTAINLGGVEIGQLARGDTVAPPGAFAATRRFDAELAVLPSARAIRHGARVRIHHGTSEVLGRVAISRVSPGPGGADAGAPLTSEVPPGGRAFVRFRLEAPVVVTRGDRYVVRAYSPPVTIAGGLILDPFPPRRAIRTPAGWTRFDRLAPGGALHDPDAVDRALDVLVGEAGAQGLGRDALGARLGLSAAAGEAAVARAAAGGRVQRVGDRLVSAGLIASMKAALLEALRQHHRSEPLSDGLPREEARTRLPGAMGPAVFEQVLQELVDAKQIVARDRLALASHRVALSGEDAEAAAALERELQTSSLRPPDRATLTRAIAVDGAVLDRVVQVLVRRKTLVRVDTLLFHADALERLKADVRSLRTEDREVRVDVATFKERYGITRKYAIPLLEYLDRERVTRRVGDARIVL